MLRLVTIPNVNCSQKVFNRPHIHKINNPLVRLKALSYKSLKKCVFTEEKMVKLGDGGTTEPELKSARVSNEI